MDEYFACINIPLELSSLHFDSRLNILWVHLIFPLSAMKRVRFFSQKGWHLSMAISNLLNAIRNEKDI